MFADQFESAFLDSPIVKGVFDKVCSLDLPTYSYMCEHTINWVQDEKDLSQSKENSVSVDVADKHKQNIENQKDYTDDNEESMHR